MLAGPLHFDPDHHVYTVDGIEVPGVTSILKPLSDQEYRGVAPGVMERARQLGVATHKLIELDLKGTLDEDALDDALRPYLAQWRQFLATSGFGAALSETKVLSRRYGFAGQLDLFGSLNGEAALIDAKRTAAVPRTAGPQTAGYEIALRETHPEVVASLARGPRDGRIHRFALHLAPDGWRLVPFRDPADQRVFLSALTINTWSRAA